MEASLIFNISKDITNLSQKALKLCSEKFKEIEKTEQYNQEKVLKAFIDSKISESHFAPSTGYAYSDRGREKLDELYMRIFCAEDALARQSFSSGTHALTVALFGLLRPGDSVLSVTGTPYDTMLEVIDSKNKNFGSLKDFQINFECINLTGNKETYYNLLKNKLTKNSFKMVYIQRSRGYTLRNSLSVEEIKELASLIKKVSPKSIILIDNCYGEFVQLQEPLEVGADIIVGSLIKNPGGGIAPTGGYIAGKKNMIELCCYRLTAPGIGREIGASLSGHREFFMGAFNAPAATAQALKTAVYAAALFKLMGYEVYPEYDSPRYDIVQSIILKTPNSLINFCKGLQSGSPVDSFVSPEPWDMPGYEDKVIMAAGAFTLGSSIELSADAPLRSPYAVWIQGGTNFQSAKIGIMKAAESVIKNPA